MLKSLALSGAVSETSEKRPSDPLLYERHDAIEKFLMGDFLQAS